MYPLISKFLTAFAIGAVLMLTLSFTIYRKSYYYQKAKTEAEGVKSKPGLLSRLITLLILLAMVGFFTLFDLWISSSGSHTFIRFFSFNLLLIISLSLFDAVFIDYFLLVVWRPGILRLPDGQPTREAMLRHIKKQFTAGWIFMLPIAFFSASLFTLLGAGIS